MKALILAAGKGTRLGALTAATPKPMLPIAGEPLLAHTVRWLVAQGVHEIAINLHHAADKVQCYFRSGDPFGARITYSFEPVLLGTAGAAKRLEHFLDERFVVVYGDVYTNVSLRALEQAHCDCLAAHPERADADAAVTLALYRVPRPWECGLVEVDAQGRVLRFVEKPPRDQVFTDWANAGIQIVEPGLLAHTPAGVEQDFGRDLLPQMLRRQMPLFAQPIAAHEFVIDIGTPEGYTAAQRQAHAPTYHAAWSPSVRAGVPSQ